MLNAKYIVKANTPQEMRDEIVAWLTRHAISYAAGARIATKKTVKSNMLLQAGTLEAAAKFISEVVIEPE